MNPYQPDFAVKMIDASRLSLRKKEPVASMLSIQHLNYIM